MLLNIFFNEIYCHVDPEAFTFRSDSNSIVIRTFVVVSNQKPHRILAVGEEVPDDSSGTKISLFKPPPDDWQESKLECLNAFFRYAIVKIYNRRAVIRPKVIFENAASLRFLLGGYERDILQGAMMAAGARGCIFKGA